MIVSRRLSAQFGALKRQNAHGDLSERRLSTDPPMQTHHSPQLPSRPPSTHTPWSGRGSWRPGGARHCTNDLDARGRVCSALPGSMVVGMEAPHPYPYEPAPGDGAPSIPVSADPPPEACSDLHYSVRSPRSADIDGASSRRVPACGVKASVGLCRIMQVDLWAVPSSPRSGLVVWVMGGESGSVRCIGPWRDRSVKRDHPGASKVARGRGRAGAGRRQERRPEPRAARRPAVRAGGV